MPNLEGCRGCPGFKPFPPESQHQKFNACTYVGTINYHYFRTELCPCKNCLVKLLCGKTKWKDKADCEKFMEAISNPRLYRTNMVAKVRDMAIFPPMKEE